MCGEVLACLALASSISILSYKLALLLVVLLNISLLTFCQSKIGFINVQILKGEAECYRLSEWPPWDLGLTTI